MIKKIFILILTILFLSGCSAKTQEEITFSTWGSVSEIKILKKIITEFESVNPNVKVNLIHIPQNYFQKIHLLFASNTPPDVIFMNNLYLPEYKNYLYEMTDKINKNEFFPQAIDGMSIENKLFAVPRDVSNLLVYINQDLIDIPPSTWTIDDLSELSRSLLSKGVYGIGCDDDIYWVTPYFAYFGGGILDDDLNSIIDSEASKRAINFYKDLIYKYKVAPSKSQIGSSTLAQMFIDEKIGMYVSGRWMFPKISEKADFNWAVINFPIGKSPQLCDVSGWAVSKKAKNIEGALKLVNFLSSEKSSEYFTSTGLIVPARIKTSLMLENSKHNEKAFIEAVKLSKSTPVNKYYRRLVSSYKID